jgi:hypothetical protein
MYKLKSGAGYITSSDKYVKLLDSSAPSTPTPPATPKLKYTTGDYVTIVSDLRVRSGAGTNYAQRKFSEMTAGSRSINAVYKSTGLAYYASGITFTALEVVNKEKEAWARTPSGWVCLEMNGEKFVRK